MRSEHTPEWDLVLACVRWAVNEDEGQVVAEKAALVADWVAFIEQADDHALLPLAGDCLGDCEAVPAETRRALKHAFAANARQFLILSHELNRLLKIFADAGIKVVTLKGPALGEALYRDPAHRASGDLDLLVHPRDLAATETLLSSQGYREPGRASVIRTRRAFRNWSNEALFEHPASRIAIDLHWSLMPPGFPIQFSTSDFLSRATGTRLAPADELAYLRGHAAKHGEPNLSRTIDIELLLKSFPEFRTVASSPIPSTESRRYRIRTALVPTEIDWATWPGLPPLLYFPLRIFRLTRKYLLNSGRTELL